MGYFGEDGVLERAENHRLRELARPFLEDGADNIPDGVNKEVAVSERGTVAKLVDEVPKESEQVRKNQDVNNYPWATLDVADLSDLGLKHEQAIIDMDRAYLSHKEAVDTFGEFRVLQQDMKLLENLLTLEGNQGIVPRDFKPQNICYFETEDGFEPRVVDVYDGVENPFYTGVNPEDPYNLARSLGLYIRGNHLYDGFADLYNENLARVEREVLESLERDISEVDYRGDSERKTKPTRDFEQVFRDNPI